MTQIVETGKWITTDLDKGDQVKTHDTFDQAISYGASLVGNRSVGGCGGIFLLGPGDGTTRIMIQKEIKVSE